jgi:FAD/FMN-containing dehydrogenase
MTDTHSFPLPVDEPTPAVDFLSSRSAILAAPPAVIGPGSEDYDAARRAWNLHVDQRPAGVCIARRVQDVQAAVAYARERGLTVAAQSTGHLSDTLPSLERTLLLKLALHDGEVAVDPVARTARIKAGARWGAP